jgi:hypothetical protein
MRAAQLTRSTAPVAAFPLQEHLCAVLSSPTRRNHQTIGNPQVAARGNA